MKERKNLAKHAFLKQSKSQILLLGLVNEPEEQLNPAKDRQSEQSEILEEMPRNVTFILFVQKHSF
jgi:hypothetical protein